MPKFTVLEPTYINHTVVSEGTIDFNPPRDAEGNPLVEIGKTLAPVDAEAEAYVAEAKAHFDKVRASRKAEEVNAFDSAVSAKVNELLSPLLEVFKSVQFTKAPAKAKAADPAPADTPADTPIA